MQSMEERYKKYIEKAKSVIKTLDPKQNPNAVPEVSALRKQLNEKDALIESLEQVCLMKKSFFTEKKILEFCQFTGDRKSSRGQRNGRKANFICILQLINAGSQVARNL